MLKIVRSSTLKDIQRKNEVLSSRLTQERRLYESQVKDITDVLEEIVANSTKIKKTDIVKKLKELI